jgi:hypothetical protein
MLSSIFEQFVQESSVSVMAKLVIQATYRGMMIAIPPLEWEVFRDVSVDQIVQILQQLATGVNLKRFLKSIRGSKKKREPLIVDKKHCHVSTARLLNTYQTNNI